MANKFYPILDQIDGITDTFTLPEAFVAGSTVLAYNGQIFDKGQNILAEVTSGTPSVQLSFVPATDTHTLMIIYTPKKGSSGARAQTFPPGGMLNDY